MRKTVKCGKLSNEENSQMWKTVNEENCNVNRKWIVYPLNGKQ